MGAGSPPREEHGNWQEHAISMWSLCLQPIEDSQFYMYWTGIAGALIGQFWWDLRPILTTWALLLWLSCLLGQLGLWQQYCNGNVQQPLCRCDLGWLDFRPWIGLLKLKFRSRFVGGEWERLIGRPPFKLLENLILCRKFFNFCPFRNF